MAALAPTRLAHLERTAPAGAVPTAAPPARTRPGPAWWPAARPGPAEEPPPGLALSPGATAVSSSRPGAPPAPSAAPAPRAPSRSADPAQPRRDARVARTAQAPGRPCLRPTGTPHSCRGRCRGHGRNGPPDCTLLWPPGLPYSQAPAGVGGSPGKPSGRGRWGAGAPSGAGASPSPCPQAPITSKQCRPHLGPNSPSPPPHPRSFCLGRGDSQHRLASGRGEAVWVCTAAWPCTPEVTVISTEQPEHTYPGLGSPPAQPFLRVYSLACVGGSGVGVSMLWGPRRF